MEWTPLPTSYMDSVWEGNKRYRRIVNSDHTVSFLDLTDYYIKSDEFLTAAEVNRINQAINLLMTEDRGIKPLLSVSVVTGAQITVTNGEIQQTASSVGQTITFALPDYGTYTVRAVKNNNTTQTVVNVDTVKIYPVTLTF